LIMCGVALLLTWYKRALAVAARRHKRPVHSA